MRWWFLLPLVLSCHKTPPAGEDVVSPADVAPEVPVSFTPDPVEDGLVVRLFDAEAPPPGSDPLTRPPATPLDAAAATALLARMPALEADPTDVTELALRQGPQPPPRTGASVQTGFPGTPTPVPGATPGPLAVLRHAPDGEVPLAPHLSVTFSEPMVAVTSQDEAARTVPVKLAPEVPGAWRWLGTKTLIFEPTTRFPMATAFTVDIPAGTTSITGSPLKEAAHWTFGTPAPKVIVSGPVNGTSVVDSPPLQPTFWFVFDQKVDPVAVLPSIGLTAGRGPPLALRLATAEELTAVQALKGAAYAADRVVAVVPVTPLPLNTEATVAIAAGAPSAEGPRTMVQARSWRLRTYGPLAVTDSECGWDGCHPGDGFSIRLTNALDTLVFDPTTVRLEPPVPGVNIVASGNSLWISGETRGRTTYTVTLPAALRDVYGQSLGKDVARTFNVGAAERQLTGPPGGLVVADPASPPKISVWTVNERALKVSIHRVKPTDWDRYGDWLQDERTQGVPGEALATLTVPVKEDPDNRVETTIDLTPYLRNQVGHFIVRVNQTNPPREEWRRQSWNGWVQVTGIGLTAFVDGDRVLAWASELGTGKPLAGVALALGPDGARGETAADGMGNLALAANRTTLLVATRGTDTAFVPASEYPSRWSGWNRADRSPDLRWYLASDRGLYRPGETVHFKGWMRVADGADVVLPDPMIRAVKWTLRSSLGNPLAEGTAEVSSTGALDVTVALPKTPDLGSASLLVEPVGSWSGNPGSTAVDIED